MKILQLKFKIMKDSIILKSYLIMTNHQLIYFLDYLAIKTSQILGIQAQTDCSPINP